MYITPVKTIFAVIGIFTAFVRIQAQNISEPVTLAMAETGAYSIIERSNWRRFNNGIYVGLMRQEIRASIIPKPAEKNDGKSNGTYLYHGNFFVLQNTLRDMKQSAQAIDAVVPVNFELLENRTMVIENDRGFPTMRGFPVFPAGKVTPGFKWRAPGNRAVNPFNPEQPVIVPFTAEYEYRGVEEYRNMRVHRIHATYINRYQNKTPAEDSFSQVRGNHEVDILLRVEDGLPVFMRDTLDETYTTADGSTVQFKGFTLTFGEGIVPMDRGEIIASLETVINTEQLPDPSINSADFQDSAIDVATVPEGIRLTVKDIRFAPDSAEFLPAEKPRIDLIAEALKQIPNRTFLVEGHTAATGRPAGEMELSVERAKQMVDELAKRGIGADRFIYKGWGGTKPLADNSTDAGRSDNRRVEITILE